MTDHAYLFECKGIQRYVFVSGRLRQVIGASDLVANIASSDRDSDGDDVLQLALSVAAPEAGWSRRAGGAFCLHAEDEESLARFRRLWRLAFGVRHPGLEFVDGAPASRSDPMTAEKAAYDERTAARENGTAFLPPSGHPFARFNPRTGFVAVHEVRKGEDTALLDAVGAPAHRRGEELAKNPRSDGVALRFLPGEAAKAYRFPRHFEPREATPDNPVFPFVGNDRRIGFIHADLSGLGEIFRCVKEKAQSPEDVFTIAQAVEGAIAGAAHSACRAVLLDRARDGVVPARPVLLGGDDVKIIARADLAIAFAEKFLRAVEDLTDNAFARLRKRYPDLPDHLSACAGIAVVSAGHPFQTAARLAEGLCDSAKKKAKQADGPPWPSFLEFAVATSTIDEDFDSWREREQEISPVDNRPALLAAAGPRRVGGAADGESLESLLRLAEALSAAEGRGKLMEAFALRHDSCAEAIGPWKRFWAILEDDKATELRRALAECAPAAACSDGAPCLDAAIGVMSDALELIDIGAVPGEGGKGGAP